MTYEEKAFEEAQKRALAIFLERHRKYGRNNIAMFGLVGIIVRLGDKFSRLRELAKNLSLSNQSVDEAFDDETLADTLIDIANYALIGLVVLDGNWGKEEAPCGNDKALEQ